MTAGSSAVVAGGAEGLGARGTGYSAQHFVAGVLGMITLWLGLVCIFRAEFLVGFVNFHPSPPHLLYFLCI